jgi:small redox-active disulfide protein 2
MTPSTAFVIAGVLFNELRRGMKEIKVLGSGCANCNNTVKLIEETAKSLGVLIELEKVTDMAEILGYGVMSAPGVMVDGWLVHSGGVPGKSAVEMWLNASADSCGCGDDKCC